MKITAYNWLLSIDAYCSIEIELSNKDPLYVYEIAIPRVGQSRSEPVFRCCEGAKNIWKTSIIEIYSKRYSERYSSQMPIHKFMKYITKVEVHQV